MLPQQPLPKQSVMPLCVCCQCTAVSSSTQRYCLCCPAACETINLRTFKCVILQHHTTKCVILQHHTTRCVILQHHTTEVVAFISQPCLLASAGAASLASGLMALASLTKVSAAHCLNSSRHGRAPLACSQTAKPQPLARAWGNVL